MEFQTLTVHHYAEKPEDERRVTLSPANINVVAAEAEDVMVAGLSRRNVVVLFVDGGSIDLTVNHGDLSALETAVGSYCLG